MGYALRLPWVKLWQSLTDAQRKPGAPVPVPALSPEQQKLLLSGLQGDLTGMFVGIVRQGLGDRLDEAALSLDFGKRANGQLEALGYERRLRLMEGERELDAGRLEAQPFLLRLLPAGDAIMRKKASLEMKEEPLAGVAERLSEILAAPVVVQEPQAEVKLTGDLKQKPVRLLLHWVERHTGLQWCKREDAYVLAAPVSVADLTQDPERLMALLRQGLPADGPPPDPTAFLKSLTADDRAALAGGPVRFSDLSLDFQEAVYGLMAAGLRMAVDGLGARLQSGRRLGEARVRLETKQGDDRYLGQVDKDELSIEVPGLERRSLGWVE